MNETQPVCSKCQKPLPPDVPLGLCPQCLVKAGFATGTESGADAREFSPPDPAELAKLFPQFEILGLIGRGGMGAVYKARQPALDRLIALKILPPRAGNDPGFTERFSREARALARLNHPNIVSVHDFGQAGGLYYLVMEFVDGANLRDIERSGRLTPKEALEIVPQICDALQFAHDEGIVHRDIKPENILIDKKGRVKITDFGIAKIIGATPEKIGLTGARDVIGTPHYMAPEQIEKPNTVDHRADIYSLGVVFYELLTGELPMGRFLPPSSKVQVDVRFDHVVLRALEKEPERRYQHASEVKTDIQTIGVPPKISAPPEAEIPSSHNWTLVALILGAVVIVAGLVALSFVLLFFLHSKSGAAASGTMPTQRIPITNSTVTTASPQPAGATVPVPTPQPSSPGLLRYRWVTGQNYVYAVEFKAETETQVQTMAGDVIYTVRDLTGDIATLGFKNQMGVLQRHPKPGTSSTLRLPLGPANFWPGGPFSSPREIKVDSAGNVIEHSGQNTQLPQALGNVEILVFTPFPARNESAWEAQSGCVIRQTQLVPLAPGSRFARKERTNFPAHEKTSYRMGPIDKDGAHILESYELKTEEMTQGKPRMELTGNGTITFDTSLGLPRAMEFKGVFTETTENTTRLTPVTLQYHLLEGIEKTNALVPPVPPKIERKELTEIELRRTLIDLKSLNIARRTSAAAKLARAKPSAENQEVAAALIVALHDSEWPIRADAVRALKEWGTDQAYEPILETLSDPQLSVRWAAVDTLTCWKTPQTATALTEHMAAGFDISETSRALRALGPTAEDAVDLLLNQSDRHVRSEACRILKDIGTRKSIPPLTAVAGSSDDLTAAAAEEALKAIQAQR